MANWIDIDDVKTYLWITWNEQDAKINLLIPAIQSNLIGIIWDIEESEKTELISICDLDRDNSFVVDNWPVTSVDKINWVAYIWILNTDYQIRLWRKIYINDIWNYLNSSVFNNFEITYTSWYENIPDDIKLLMYIMISAELNREAGKTVSSYKVWDTSVSFTDTEASPLIIQSIIWKYKLINI